MDFAVEIYAAAAARVFFYEFQLAAMMPPDVSLLAKKSLNSAQNNDG